MPVWLLPCGGAAKFFSCNSCEGSSPCGMPSVSCLYFLPLPMAPWPERWPKCRCGSFMFNPGPRVYSTEPAQHGQSRSLYCPQPQVYAGGWISHSWPGICSPEGSACRRCRASAPTLSGSLLCASIPPTPPSPPLQESYPAVPPIWSVESDDPNLAAILERLVEVRKGNTLVRHSAAWERGGLAALWG